MASDKDLDFDVRFAFKAIGKVLNHRGPDETAEVFEGRVFTGINRLAIVDIQNGTQPFKSEDNSLSVTGNGEIYNYQELREELILAGHKLVSNSDIEVVVHLYEIYGDAFVHKLRGMFALAIVDKNKSELKIFIDRLGEKPIYWSFQDGRFTYASELMPFLKAGIVEMRLDPAQIPVYLKHGFTLDPFTLVKDVYRLCGGTYLTFSFLKFSIFQTRYWNPTALTETISNPVTRTRDVLGVISNTIGQGEVKIAIALSGGIDSSIIAKLTRASIPNLETLTIGYKERSRHDESRDAQKIAESLGLESTISQISSPSAAINLQELCSVIDDPVADIAGINYLQIFKIAKQRGIKVVLLGQGGDELFSGYSWQYWVSRRAKARVSTLNGKLDITSYFRLFKNPVRKMTSLNIGDIYGNIRHNYEIFYQLFEDLRDFRKKNADIDLSSFNYNSRSRDKYSKKIGRFLNIKLDDSRMISIADYEIIEKICRIHLLKDYLRINGFLQIDKISMSQSVEARNPLADYLLLETVLQSDWSSTKTPTKSLLRSACEPLREITHSDVQKRGFSPPTRIWFRKILETYKKELLNPRSLEMGLYPKNWSNYFIKPFNIFGLKSPIWFSIVFLELWIRETEKKCGKRFAPIME